MKTLIRTAACLAALVMVSGCASTKIADRDTYQGPKIGRPDRILVYDFAASPADLPAWSDAARQHANTAVAGTPEELETGRKLGREISSQLITSIRQMGLNAVSAVDQNPRKGDAMLIGYFESVDTGSAAKRILIGFGSGSAELKTRVEGYAVTDEGIRRLGGGTVDSAGSKGPGAVVPIAVTIATANPIGLVVSGAVKATGELSGRTTIEGSAKRSAEAITEELRTAFERHGWIRK